MANLQYIGARYVPKFFENPDDNDSPEWKPNVGYEALVVVTYLADSYTSKIPVPANIGNPAANPKYWAKTGQFNAAVQNLQNEVSSINNTIGSDDLDTEADTLKGAINELYNGKAAFFFPHQLSTVFQSACSLMVVDKKGYLFDAGSSSDSANFIGYFNTLLTSGIFDELAGIFISHYHGDHVDGLNAILQALPHDNCHAYIAMNFAGYYSGDELENITNKRNSVINALNDNNVPYTEINSERTIKISADVSVDLSNSTPAAYAHYYAINSVYNNYSMVALVKVGEIYAMYPADIQRDAQDYIVSRQKLPRIFLYSIHHHGVQNDDNIEYLEMIKPFFGVIQMTHNRTFLPQSMCANYSCEYLISCGYSSCEFVMNKESGFIVDGCQVETYGWQQSTIDYYVNNEYVGDLHDGTPEHPFTNINEIAMFIKDQRNMAYNIYIEATDTIYGQLYVRGFSNCVIAIKTKPNDDNKKALVDGFRINNVSNVTISNLEFVDTRTIWNVNDLIGFVDCAQVEFNSCVFDASYSTTPATRITASAIASRISSIYLTGCTFKNITKVITTYKYSEVVTNGITFENVGVCYTLVGTRFLIRGVDTMTDSDYYMGGFSDQSIRPVDIALITNATEFASLKSLIATNSVYGSSNDFMYNGKLMHIDGNMIVGDAVTDLDDAIISGTFTYTGTSVNRPTGTTGGGVIEVKRYNANFFVQIAYPNDKTSVDIFYRWHSDEGFGSWLSVTPT